MDPFAPFSFLARLINYSHKLNFSQAEIRVFNDFLKAISDRMSCIDSYRIKLSAVISVRFEDLINQEIERTRSALGDARRLVEWMQEARSGAQAAVGKIQWVLTYRKAAETYFLLLNLCHDTLLSIEERLAGMDEKLPRPPKNYFQDTRRWMLRRLAERATRNSLMYSGEGVWLSQLLSSDYDKVRLFPIMEHKQTINVYSALNSFLPWHRPVVLGQGFTSPKGYN